MLEGVTNKFQYLNILMQQKFILLLCYSLAGAPSGQAAYLHCGSTCI